MSTVLNNNSNNNTKIHIGSVGIHGDVYQVFKTSFITFDELRQKYPNNWGISSDKTATEWVNGSLSHRIQLDKNVAVSFMDAFVNENPDENIHNIRVVYFIDDTLNRLYYLVYQNGAIYEHDMILSHNDMGLSEYIIAFQGYMTKVNIIRKYST